MATTSSVDDSKQPEEADFTQAHRKRAWATPAVIVESAQVADICGGKVYTNINETSNGTRAPS